ncbi:geranylgeranyl reductase family protein [Maridesulfovibrio sp.]|uniref:geranylgeranyl reductase family protein n=1 Tax=Maridesulfovibrio sp. TaxID=2795000 RepID=UPI002A18B374|nr:geranylgeranyl reductase family protein [Maridesulfovibrio sp.]
MSGKFDVVIAGGGPSGSTAAYILARKGFRVALIDKAEFPRKKLCGGLITHKTVTLLDKIYGCGAATLHEKGLIRFESPEYSINYRDHNIRDAESSIPFRFIDRVDFDYFLLQKAAEAGAHIFTGEEITDCNYRDAEVKTASRRIYKGQYLLGTDGVNSTIRRFLPYDKKKWRSDMAATIEIIFNAEDFPRRITRPELYIGYLRAGYIWVFPAGDKVVTGIGALSRCTVDFKSTFMNFLRSQGVANPEALPMRGFPLPYGNYMKNPCFGRTLLAGDAAGIVEPLFGEGIFYALQSGRYAAESLARGLSENRNPEKFYLERLEKYVYPELKYSNRLRWALFYSQPILKHMSFKIAFKSMPRLLADMVHGVRSYKFMLRKEWD